MAKQMSAKWKLLKQLLDRIDSPPHIDSKIIMLVQKLTE